MLRIMKKKTPPALRLTFDTLTFGSKVVPCANVEAAQTLLAKHWEDCGLGASDMNDGHGYVFDASGTALGRFSYNGNWHPAVPAWSSDKVEARNLRVAQSILWRS